jgi:hypothetical protein
VAVLLAAMTATPPEVSMQSAPTPYQQLARDLFRELIEVNTTTRKST